MVLSSVRWDENFLGEDIHILRGESGPRLDQLLVISRVGVAGTINGAAPLPGAVTVRFDGLFAGAPAAHGASVALATGVVTATARPGAPAPAIRNFVVRGTVTEGAVSMTVSVRVHIHETVAATWVTPATMTLRSGASGVRPTVLARFDDGVVGDISAWSRLPAGSPSRLQWHSPTPATVNVTADGTFTLGPPGGPVVISVAIGTPPLVAGPAISGTTSVNVVAGWSTATTLDFVPGAGPGPAGFASAPNVLLLPDGFTTRAQFQTFVRRLVHRLTHDQLMRPFDLLRGQINFWSAWVPSIESNISCRSELGEIVGARRNRRRQTGVPFPTAPAAGAAVWTLEEFVHEVGLPIAADRTRPLTGGANPLLPEWQTLYGAKVTLARANARDDATSPRRWEQWRGLADRSLVNERDTAFRAHIGGRPLVGFDNAHRGFEVRIDDSDFDAFLNGLTLAPFGRIGVTWGGGAGGPVGLVPGKDQGMVCFVGLSHRSSGMNWGTAFGTSIGAETSVLVNAVANGLNLVVRSVPARPIADTVGTAAHETVHGLGLEDEYGGEPAPPAGTTFPDDGNVQEDAGVRVGANLVSPNIKWGRWHRISHAGVLSATPTAAPGANNFRLPMRGTQGRGFAVGNQVRVRTRPLVGSTVSPVLNVTAATPAELIVHDPSGTFVPGTFPGTPNGHTGSIVLRPVRATAAPHDERMLVAPRIAAHLNGQPFPLNATAARRAAGAACTTDDRDMLPAVFIPPAIATQIRTSARPRFSAWLVGLYDGGGQFDCGVFHPTGTCLMRQVEISTRRGTLYQFCTVCRYVLVDRLDPSLHGVIDRNYAPRYPDP